MNTSEFQLPASWACAFVNSDQSGFDDEEIEAIGMFSEYLLKNGINGNAIEIKDDTGFRPYHDAYNFYPYAADCCTFVFCSI